MKIGLYQYQIDWENKKKNIAKLKGILERESENLDMILLPEMSFTGFSMNSKITGEVNKETIDIVSLLSKEYCVYIGFGWVNNVENSENHYSVIDCKGEIVSDYIKIHPFSYSEEDKHFVGGKSITFFEKDGMLFTTAICYDLRFPEVFRIASKKADVIIVPANWPSKRNDHWETLLKARAIENQVYVIGINCVGNINGIDYCGNSCVIAPDGRIIAKAYGTEALITSEIDNDISEYRERFPVYKDRRDDIYLKLLKEVEQ